MSRQSRMSTYLTPGATISTPTTTGDPPPDLFPGFNNYTPPSFSSSTTTPATATGTGTATGTATATTNDCSNDRDNPLQNPSNYITQIIEVAKHELMTEKAQKSLMDDRMENLNGLLKEIDDTDWMFEVPPSSTNVLFGNSSSSSGGGGGGSGSGSAGRGVVRFSSQRGYGLGADEKVFSLGSQL